MGEPPQFPPPEADDASVRNSHGSEFLHAEPFHEAPLQEITLGDSDHARFLRRVRRLLIAGIVSFTVVSWMLVRGTGMMGIRMGASDPVAVVRTELGSLANGDLRSGYAQLSERYRKEVSFESYNALVTSHRQMFLTRKFRVTRRDERNGRMLIETQLTSASGEQFLARFTMIQSAGRWWIDDLHWEERPESHSLQA